MIGPGSAEGDCWATAVRPTDNLLVVLATPAGPQRRVVSDALAEHGVRVAGVGSLHALRAAADRLRPDLVVVDAALAAHQTDILSFVREAGTPLIATSVHSPRLRVDLLLAGADDCLPAPFAPEELTARVVAIARRTFRGSPPAADLLRSGPFRIDLRARRVTVCGTEAFLTAREFDLLSYFARHCGQVLPRDRLLAEVWGYTIGDASTVTVHVRRLRSKIEIDPSRPEFIQTIWGIGYRFCSAEDDAETGRVAVRAEQRAIASSASD